MITWHICPNGQRTSWDADLSGDDPTASTTCPACGTSFVYTAAGWVAAHPMPDPLPANPVYGVDYGGGCDRDTCPCRQPEPVCGEWMGGGDTQWCPRCGWTERFHPEGPTDA